MKKQTFEIKGEYIELIKLLKASGLCDMGRDAKFAVSNQQVKVNGEINFSVLRNFPYASITFQNVEIRESFKGSKSN